jgi:hypothetical protein
MNIDAYKTASKDELYVHKLCQKSGHTFQNSTVLWRRGDFSRQLFGALQLQSGFVIAPVSEPFALSQRAMALPLSHVAEIWQSNQPPAHVIIA